MVWFLSARLVCHPHRIEHTAPALAARGVRTATVAEQVKISGVRREPGNARFQSRALRRAMPQRISTGSAASHQDSTAIMARGDAIASKFEQRASVQPHETRRRLGALRWRRRSRGQRGEATTGMNAGGGANSAAGAKTHPASTRNAASSRRRDKLNSCTVQYARYICPLADHVTT